MKLHVLGIDLGKTVFHLVGLDSTGRVVMRKKCGTDVHTETISIAVLNSSDKLVMECTIET